MKRRFIHLVIGATFIMLLTACTTIPKIAEFEPDYYEDNDVRIWYAIGSTVHHLEIENKTDDDLLIDFNRCSIISTLGQTRSLNLSGLDSHIPPHSSIILNSNQLAFFYYDIYSEFELKDDSSDSGTYSIGIYNETKQIESWKGKLIRLYIPMQIGTRNKTLDLSLVINGVKSKR